MRQGRGEKEKLAQTTAQKAKRPPQGRPWHSFLSGAGAGIKLLKLNIHINNLYKFNSIYTPAYTPTFGFLALPESYPHGQEFLPSLST